MSDRPISGRSPRGASRPVGDDASNRHPQTDATDLPGEGLESDPRPRSRNLRMVKGNRPDQEENNSTRIMSVDDVDGGDADSFADDAEATQAGPPISIEIIDGPDAGKKKRVRGGRMVVGRGDGCDLKLRDTSASRRHLELIVGMSGCTVRDLGSGNGTKVNGTKVDEAQVGHGDEIILGTTLLRVVDEMQALEERRRPKEPEPPPEVEPFDEGAEPAPPARRTSTQSRSRARPPGTEAVSIPLAEPRSKRNPIILAALGAGALLLLGVLLAVLRPSHPAAPAQETAKVDVQVAKLAQEGKAALASGEYDKADELWKQIEELEPAYGDLAELREHTTRERAAKKSLLAAQGLIAEHKFDAARDALKSVAPESVVSDQATDLLKTLDAKQAEFMLGSAEEKLAAGDIDGAKAMLPEVGRVNPAGFDKLNKEIEVAQAKADREALAHIKNKRKREQMMRQMKARKAADAVRKELEGGYRKFHEANTPGQFDRAASEFDRIAEQSSNSGVRSKARELAKSTRALGRFLGDADQLDADQSYAAEVTPLSGALSALEKIDPSGPLANKLKNRMVRGLVIKGRDAAARQDYSVAAKAFAKALQLRPNDSTAKDGMNNLRSRAHDVYLQAYEQQDRDPDGARKLFQAVMEMTPQGDELHEKASKRLKSMSGAKGDDE